ncbi:MAG: valine--tRNA ligase [PVC group bacterium]|nr:valine--tRNA ligase [PVC group bacterium]
MSELATKYSFKDIEEKWYQQWEQNKFFHAQVNTDKKPYVIVIPPPNVTGILHMGHALNNTIQDILIRYKKMNGNESLWMPGTDHAGIATQNVVERKLAKENLTRQDVGREKFLKRVWEWKQEYGSTIIRQLKSLGCACDWDRTRFTMDEGYSDAVLEVFVQLYKKDRIYRGNYIINWCPRCQTALSDEEAPHKDLNGSLYYMKYPIKDSEEYVVVATTRPETMLGDTAVAVNPKDERYKHLIGQTVILPLMDREIPIISDDFVDPEFGTGAVKVTPAHDPNDYQMGKRHDLEFINVMHPDASMNENAGEYAGQDRFQARKEIIEDLTRRELFLKVESHNNAVGHCYRCHSVVEPYLSKQWFVKMKPLSLPAIEAVKDGRIKFHPQRWTKVYLNWMENIQDWCISRQIWWGHRLPVYYCADCHDEEDKKGIVVSKQRPNKCPDCGGTKLVQDEDVLDTWFSSWLWPFATFGWPFSQDQKQEELKYFYPTDVLVTAPEIIFFWVARMIMSGFEFMGDIPFKDVYIHGTVRDETGRKMSKSLGNSIDPLEIIEEFGTDALRFSIISLTSVGQDVYLSKDKFEAGRNFANKIWNASRFILMNLDKDKIADDVDEYLKGEKLDLAEAWILSCFYSSLKDINKALSRYRLNEAANLIYEFFWHQFCDYYIELAKLNIKEKNIQCVLYSILEKILRVVHPFMPFITEEIWYKVNPDAGSIMQQSWPDLREELIDGSLEKDMKELVIDSTVETRKLRSENNIKPKEKKSISVFVEDANKKAALQKYEEYLKILAKIEDIEFRDKNESPGLTFVSAVTSHAVISMDVGEQIDKEGELKKVEQQISELVDHISRKDKLLANENYVKNAPAQVVEKEKNSRDELQKKMEELKKIKDACL